MILSFQSSYYWTQHAKAKMAYYKLSESRVRRVIKSPLRVEEGIAPDTVAYMQPVSYKTKNGQKTWNQELWVMVAAGANKQHITDNLQQEKDVKANNKSKVESSKQDSKFKIRNSSVRIISAWRYPGMTKPQASLPKAILDEIREALNNY